MEFLQANWLWILLGALTVGFLFRRRGGMGCGTGGHDSHDSRSSRDAHGASTARESHDGHSQESPSRDSETVLPRRHRGC
jgi:hypothetical protein